MTPEQETLVVSNIKLVAIEVHRVGLPQHADWGDMYGAGYLGLVQAAIVFDPARNVPFPAYARMRIRCALIDHIRSVAPQPRSSAKRVTGLREARAAWFQKHGREPSDHDLAASTGWTTATVRKARLEEQARALMSLDMFPADTGWLADGRLDPAQIAADAAEVDALQAAIGRLPIRQQAVIRGWFFDGRTQNDIAAELGCTSSRVSQIAAAAMRNLRAALAPFRDAA